MTEYLEHRLQRIGISGHQQLPSAAVELLMRRLSRYAASAETIQVVCSLAQGTDTIAAEYLLEMGASLKVIIPCARYESTFIDKAHREKFQELLARATGVETLSFDEPSELAFLAAGRRVVDICDELIALWDGAPSRGLGGTADVVAYAREKDKPLEIIWPTGVQRD